MSSTSNNKRNGGRDCGCTGTDKWFDRICGALLWTSVAISLLILIMASLPFGLLIIMYLAFATDMFAP